MNDPQTPERRADYVRLQAQVADLLAAVDRNSDAVAKLSGTLADVNHLRESLAEQGDVLTSTAAHLTSDAARTRRRAVTAAVAVALFAASASLLGYHLSQDSAQARAQTSRVQCEKRNVQADTLNAYLNSQITLARRQISIEQANTVASAATRRSRIAAWQAVLTANQNALRAFNAVHVDCAHQFPHTHP